MKKASDKQIVDTYSETKNVWEVGKRLGMAGQTVHGRLRKLGVKLRNPKFTDEELEYLRLHYNEYAGQDKLKELATKMGRTIPFLCRKAGLLGLTNHRRKRPDIAKWSTITEEEARLIFEKFRKSSQDIKRFARRHKYGASGLDQTFRKFFPDEYEFVVGARKRKSSPYRLGRAFEYRVRDYLKKLNYFVLRSPQSKGPVDLIALKRGGGEILGIQCKRGGYLKTIEEGNALYEFCQSIGARTIVAGMPQSRGIAFWEITGIAKAKGQNKQIVTFN